MRVVEDRRDLAAQAHAAEALVRHERNVFAGEPQHRVGGGLAAESRCRPRRRRRRPGGPCPSASSMNCDRAALAVFLRLDAVARRSSAWPGRAAGCPGAGPGVGRRRQVVGVGFAGHLEHGDGDRLCGTSGRLVNHSASAQLCSTALALALPALAFSCDVVEGVEHQQGVLQRRRRRRRHARRRRAGRSAA